jgi:phosphate starvation-inducible protein PhoH and related proteins
MARRQLEISNDVAAELAGAQDSILKTLEEHLSCEVFLRGNVITLDGDAEAVAEAVTVINELSAMAGRGHDVDAATIDAVGRVLEQREQPSAVLEDVVWRHRNLRVAPRSVNQKRYVDAVRKNTVTFGIGPALGCGHDVLDRGAHVLGLCRPGLRERSTGSSSPAPRSRPASASASSRAT